MCNELLCSDVKSLLTLPAIDVTDVIREPTINENNEFSIMEPISTSIKIMFNITFDLQPNQVKYDHVEVCFHFHTYNASVKAEARA